MDDLGGDFDRQPIGCLAQLEGHFAVDSVVDEEHGDLGDLGWPPVDLDDAVELVEGDLQLVSPDTPSSSRRHNRKSSSGLLHEAIDADSGVQGTYSVDVDGTFGLAQEIFLARTLQTLSPLSHEPVPYVISYPDIQPECPPVRTTGHHGHPFRVQR